MSRVVARGAIRVDARRAVAKLREHLLVDLNLYLLELVRAAAAGGATAIDARCDGGDVILSWDGQPLSAGTLERLLDHVLDAARDREARRLRLLALGVNAALGLDPARIDVLATTAPGRCVRARFTPAAVEASAGDAAARPACDEVPAPAGMPAVGMRVEVRRRLGWGALRRALASGRPAEIEHLAAATADFAVPITLDGAPIARPSARPPLLRVPFHVRGAKRAALEILRASPAAGTASDAEIVCTPTVEYLEHGVRLLREAWSFAPRFPSAPWGGAALPVRVLLDAEELPTNASRSALHEDSPLRSALREGAYAALLDALRALASLVYGGSAPEDLAGAPGRALAGAGVPDGVMVLERSHGLLEEALGAIACVVAGAAGADAREALPQEALALLELPLLRDGLGRPIAPAKLPGRVYGWTGREPVPEAAAPWAREIVWLRGRVAERMLAGFQIEDAAALVEQTKMGEARRKALYAHAPAEPAVAPSPEHLARAGFDVREGPCAGLRGEVALRAIDPGAAPEPARVRVLIEGRVIEAVELDRAAVPLPFEAAIAWEGQLLPRFSYEGVSQDKRFREAIGYTLRVALLAADREARRLFGIEDAEEQATEAAHKPEGPPKAAPRPGVMEGTDKDRAHLRPVIRAALGALLAAAGRLERAAPAEDAPGGAPALAPEAFPGLHRAPAWPTTEPRRFEGLHALQRYAAFRKALCFAPTGAAGRAADGRPVVAAGPHELAWIAAALPGCALIPYERALTDADALRRRKDERRRVLARSLSAIAPPEDGDAPVLESVRPWLHALAKPADAHVEAWHHALYPLAIPEAKPLLAPVAVALDSDAVTPDREWRSVLAGRSPGLVWAVERELCEAVVAALEGDTAAAERLGLRPDLAEPSTRIAAYLLRCTRSLGRRASYVSSAKQEGELLARIRALPLVPLLDAEGAAALSSLADVEGAHPPPAPIPVLDAAPGFETLDWRPVVPRDRREREAFLEWAGERAAPATGELPARRARAEEERLRRAFLAGPEHEVQDLGDLIDLPQEGRAPLSVFLAPLPPFQPEGELLSALAALQPAFESIPVAAALPRAGIAIDHAWVDVLFCRRALCRRALPLPIRVVARVDLQDPAHVLGYRDLSSAGIEIVTRRVHEAAIALAFRILTEAGLQGRGAVFFGDLRALALVAQLIATGACPMPLEARKAAALAESLRAPSVRWPTVQGGEHPLNELRTTGEELYFGARLHAGWRTGSRISDLDSPVLLLPQGAAGDHLRTILGALGFGLRDVTAAIEALQARRAAAAPAGEAPRLTGAPLHPLLRRTLVELKISDAEGEAEVIEGPAPEIQLIGVGGAERAVRAEIVLPMRVIARVEHADPSPEVAQPLLKKIAKAMGRHLLAHAARLDELPPFARAHLRRAVCKTVAEGKRVLREAAAAPLFLDTQGVKRSLDALREAPEGWACTFSPPPYPRRAYDPPALCLSQEEQTQLAAAISVRNLTRMIAGDLEGERRAAAPPLAAIALDAAARARCFQILPFEEAETAASGEIGLLLPAHAEEAGIHVHVGRRPLCRLDEDPGWPMVAAVNDDALEPNRSFGGLVKSAAEVRLRRRVRAVATRWLKARAEPPADALASRWVEQASKASRLFVAGVLWLPREWPVAPRVQITLASTSAPRTLQRALSILVAGRGVSGLVPVGGELLVWPDGAWARVADLALRAAASMVAEVAGAQPDDPAVEAYRWNLRLLGAGEGGTPAAKVVTGGHVDASGAPVVGPSEVLAELSSRGCVWVTSGRGSAHGHFPEGAPGFVLLDGSPLVHVLRHRGQDLVRELGGLDEPAALPVDPALAALSAELSAAAVAMGASRGASEAARGPEDAPALDVGRERAGAWLGQLWRSVRSLLAGGGAPADTRGESELCAAVHEALAALGLPGDPVRAVVEDLSGRPVRYEARARRLVLNPRHEALAWARARGPRDAAVVALLAAAAVGEINRALKSVTDAEERLALEQLLGSMRGAGA